MPDRPTSDLFDYVPPPYRGEPPAQSHSQTSMDAAQSIKKSIGPLHKAILFCLGNYPEGRTDEEMQIGLDMPANTQRPRRRELQLMGRIEDSGKTRLTRSSRAAVIWRLTR